MLLNFVDYIYDIDQLESVFDCKIYRLGAAASFPKAIGYTNIAHFNDIFVSLLHAGGGISRRKADVIVGGFAYALVGYLVGQTPIFRLPRKRCNYFKPYLGEFGF